MLKRLILTAILTFSAISSAQAALTDHCDWPTQIAQMHERPTRWIVTADEWNKTQCVLQNLQTELQDCAITGCSGGSGGADTTCLDVSVDCHYAGSATEGGPATTCLALNSNPTDCDNGQYAVSIAADGSLSCAQISFSEIAGILTDTQIPNNITIDNALLANALAADGDNCGLGVFAIGVDAAGNAQCSAINFSSLEGVAGDNQIPDTITINHANTCNSLAGDPLACDTNQFATGILADGSAVCSVVNFSQVGGVITDGQVPNDITIDECTLANTVDIISSVGDTTNWLLISPTNTGPITPEIDEGLIYDSINNHLGTKAFHTYFDGVVAGTFIATGTSTIIYGGDTIGTGRLEIARGGATPGSFYFYDGAGGSPLFYLNADTNDAIFIDEVTAIEFNGALNGNASTATLATLATEATALEADGTNCSGNDFAVGTDSAGNAQCAQPAFSNLSGSATDGQIPNDITIDQCTALAANGANCGGNNFALGVDASGVSECAQPAFSNLSGSAIDSQIPNDITIDQCTTATNVTVTDAGADPATFCALAGSATGNLPVQTDPGCTYNANTNALSISGAFSASNISGTNTGDDDQPECADLPALTGDVTSSACATTIANNSVTLAKQADMATNSVVYRKTAGTGDPEIQTLSTLKTDLGLAEPSWASESFAFGDRTGPTTNTYVDLFDTHENTATLQAGTHHIDIEFLLGRTSGASGTTLQFRLDSSSTAVTQYALYIQTDVTTSGGSALTGFTENTKMMNRGGSDPSSDITISTNISDGTVTYKVRITGLIKLASQRTITPQIQMSAAGPFVTTIFWGSKWFILSAPATQGYIN